MSSRLRYLALALVAAVALAILVLTLVPRQRSPGVAAVGRPAPDFTLHDLSGREVSLSQVEGRVVLLNFFATWCIPCRGEMAAINRQYLAHRSKLAVLAIDKQEPEADVAQFVRSNGYRFPTLLDPNLTVWNQYRVQIQPVSFWIDRGGTIRAVHFGAMDPGFIRREVRALAVT